ELRGRPSRRTPAARHDRLALHRIGRGEEQQRAGRDDDVARGRERGRRPELAADAVADDLEVAAAVVDEAGEGALAERAEQRGLRGGAAPLADRERGLDVGLEQRRERRAAAAELE